MNPHALRRRNLNPVGVYRDAARCSERRISQGRSLHLAAFRYSPWTIQRRFSRPLATAAGRARVPEPRDDWRRLEDDPIGFLAQNKPLSVPEEIWPHARVPPLLSLSYPMPMAHVTSQTKLSELKARVRAAGKSNQNGAARLVRSVQQSLRVEGYDVREEVLDSALRRAVAGRPR